MWINKVLGVIAIAVLASACASPAEVKNMTVAPLSVNAPSESPFVNNLRIAKVYGGKKPIQCGRLKSVEQLMNLLYVIH